MGDQVVQKVGLSDDGGKKKVTNDGVRFGRYLYHYVMGRIVHVVGGR